jgi:hypothetical protein
MGTACRVARVASCTRRLVKNGSRLTKRASGRSLHESCEGRFDLRTGAGFENLDLQSHAASSRFHVSQRGLCIRSIGRINKHGNAGGPGHKLAQESQSLSGQLGNQKVDACKVAAGRARLATRPSLTGSWPTMKTIGVVAVAALAANAVAGPPAVAITATRRRTSSAASAGRRSNDPPPSGIRSPRSRPRHSRCLSGLGEMRAVGPPMCGAI